MKDTTTQTRHYKVQLFANFNNFNVPLDDQLLGGQRKGKAAKGTEFIAAAMLRLKQLDDGVFKKYRASNHPLREAQFAVELKRGKEARFNDYRRGLETIDGGALFGASLHRLSQQQFEFCRWQ
jgi:hypothetical protein